MNQARPLPQQYALSQSAYPQATYSREQQYAARQGYDYQQYQPDPTGSDFNPPSPTNTFAQLDYMAEQEQKWNAHRAPEIALLLSTDSRITPAHIATQAAQTYLNAPSHYNIPVPSFDLLNQELRDGQTAAPPAKSASPARSGPREGSPVEAKPRYDRRDSRPPSPGESNHDRHTPTRSQGTTSMKRSPPPQNSEHLAEKPKKPKKMKKFLCCYCAEDDSGTEMTRSSDHSTSRKNDHSKASKTKLLPSQKSSRNNRDTSSVTSSSSRTKDSGSGSYHGREHSRSSYDRDYERDRERDRDRDRDIYRDRMEDDRSSKQTHGRFFMICPHGTVALLRTSETLNLGKRVINLDFM
ncbi:hypothetical protein BLNAU_15071 [Blattamonas nauphoetae]|uniref:Uncharacterized protein n=1 Tax=Blattamonas nauphoetae TaxID=2049346 RepID=A0ABQ9XIC8_9EUKA|nr:hypothetical protein BLNAU_15071 [Blattamonas nauphoetae]